ncbi:MAG: hypothetical protein V1672_00005 [Candidatus Diapherotrites archaeon]
MLTTFLIIVVIALVLGNLFLAVTKSSNKKTDESYNEESYQTFEPSDDQSGYPVQSPPGRNFNSQSLPDASTQALNEKIIMAHQRLDAMENAIVKIGKATLEKDEVKNGKIKEKLDSLINQKNNTKIELEALKDRVARLEELNDFSHKSREEETEDLKQKIHDLAYNKGSA